MPGGMYTDTRSVLRSLGALGATVAVISTFLPWYAFEVILPARGLTHVFVVPITLWEQTALAAILITLGAILALACLTVVVARWAGAVEALIGLGIAVYALIRALDVPGLGVDVAPGAARATTEVAAGTFLAMAAGAMVLIGSLADLRPAPEEVDAVGPGASRPGTGSGRFRRGAPRPTRRVAP
jgi:hypothetical protein